MPRVCRTDIKEDMTVSPDGCKGRKQLKGQYFNVPGQINGKLQPALLDEIQNI
jgi:hypothetical protein